jgi:flagellar M-ring protein FliF
MNIVTIWTDMNGRNRIGLLVGVLLILVFLVAAVIWLLQDRYAVLFSDLQPGDAAGVVEELERMKVDYQLAEGGTQILVPEDSVHETRIKLMGSGLPLSGGIGFEIFDNSDFGMTEFAQRINFQRALQGELTRTIMSLKEVKFARVHLVMPEDGLFKRENAAPSASVTLFLRRGNTPPDEQILGIQRLVSAAVPGLKAAQVTVTDQNGITLSRQIAEEHGIEAVSARLQQKKAVEQYLAAKAQEVLSRAFDSDQAMVSVDATLDFSATTTTRESVLSPEGSTGTGILRRRESKFGAGSAGKSDEASVTTEVEYQLGRSVAQIVETPGRIMRLSVGVLVPDTVSPERREQIKELVAVAVGLDMARGDAVAVYPLDSVVSQMHEQQPGASPDHPMNDMQAGNGGMQSGLSEFVARHSLLIGLIAAVVLCGLLVLLSKALAGLRRPGSGKRALSPQERDRILLKLQQWLETEPEPAGRNEAGS